MMPNPTHGQPPRLVSLKLQDFGELQTRYQSMGLAKRAAAVLADAEPALQAADRIMQSLSANENTKQAFENIRKNPALTGKMRPSEAKNAMMDSGNNFLEETHRKLAAWRKTMERLSQGESIEKDKAGREYIPQHAPLALAIAGNSSVSNYLSVLQLVLGELGKLDSRNVGEYTFTIAEIRRCATVLSDCEHASGIQSLAN